MMAKHIPGPWDLAWEDGKYGVIADAAGGLLVCVVGNNPDDGLNDIRKANATLMAAAPELLAACELVAALLDSGEWPDAYKQLSDAIAKAKGLTSE